MSPYKKEATEKDQKIWPSDVERAKQAFEKVRDEASKLSRELNMIHGPKVEQAQKMKRVISHGFDNLDASYYYLEYEYYYKPILEYYDQLSVNYGKKCIEARRLNQAYRDLQERFRAQKAAEKKPSFWSRIWGA